MSVSKAYNHVKAIFESLSEEDQKKLFEMILDLRCKFCYAKDCKGVCERDD